MTTMTIRMMHTEWKLVHPQFLSITHITLHEPGCFSVFFQKAFACVQLKWAEKPWCLYLRQHWIQNQLYDQILAIKKWKKKCHALSFSPLPLECCLGHEIVPLSVEVCVCVFELMQSRLPLKHKHENVCCTRIIVCSLELMPQQYSNKAREKKLPTLCLL